VAGLWEHGVAIADTVAKRYLRLRNLPVGLEDICLNPRCPHKRKLDTEFKPALLVEVGERLQLTTIQRTFLDRETA
jgi:hypothetical protein